MHFFENAPIRIEKSAKIWEWLKIAIFLEDQLENKIVKSSDLHVASIYTLWVIFTCRIHIYAVSYIHM